MNTLRIIFVVLLGSVSMAMGAGLNRLTDFQRITNPPPRTLFMVVTGDNATVSHAIEDTNLVNFLIGQPNFPDPGEPSNGNKGDITVSGGEWRVNSHVTNGMNSAILGKLGTNGGTAFDLVARPTDQDATPLLIYGASGQDSDLFLIRDFSGATLFGIGYDGAMHGPGLDSPRLTSSATDGYVWTASGTTGKGVWAPPSAADLSNLNGATNGLNTRVGALETRATNLEGATNGLTTRAAAVETRATNLEGATNGLHTLVANLTGATNGLRADVVNLQGATNGLNGRVANLEGSTNGLHTAVLAKLNTNSGTAFNLIARPVDSDDTPFTIRGISGQDTFLFAIFDSTDTPLFRVSEEGVLSGNVGASARLASSSTVGHVWTATDTEGRGSFQAPTGGGGLIQVGAISNFTMTVGDNLHVNGTNRQWRYVPTTNASIVFSNLFLNQPVRLRIETTNLTAGWALTFNIPAASWGSNGVPIIRTNGGWTEIEVVKVSALETNAYVVYQPRFKLTADGLCIQYLTNFLTGEVIVTNTCTGGISGADTVSNITVSATANVLLDFAAANVFKLKLLTNANYIFTNQSSLNRRGKVYFQQDTNGQRLVTQSVAGGLLQTNANMQPTTNANALDLLEVEQGFFTTNLLAWWPQNFQPRVAFTNSLADGGGGGGGGGISDDFNRSNNDSLGGNWTEAVTDIDIDSNTASAPGEFNNLPSYAIHNTPLSTVNQYIKSSLTFSGNSQPSVFFRYTDASSAFYELRFDVVNNRAKFFHWTADGGTATEITTLTALTISSPVTVGVTLTGTGNSTEVRVWLSPSGNAPDSAISWGGDTTPDATITDNPSSAVDSGLKVGIGVGASSAGAVTHDDVFGGDIP